MSTPYSGTNAELHAEQRPLSRRAGDADAAERRRYALLQAAMAYMPTAEATALTSAIALGYTAFLRADARRRAVDEAEAILTEIERRERREKEAV